MSAAVESQNRNDNAAARNLVNLVCTFGPERAQMPNFQKSV